MSISDTQFASWVSRDDARPVILAELSFAYESGGAPATGMVYLADALYATEAGETPSSISYIDAIIAVPMFARSIDTRTLVGRGRSSFGALELNNADGRLDFLLDLVIDGHDARFYIGAPSWPRDDFRLVFAATMDTLEADATSISVRLRDPSLLLDARIMGEAIGGTGPNAGRRKPYQIGIPLRVEALLGDASNLRYWVSQAAAAPDLFSVVSDAGLDVETGGASATFSGGGGTFDAPSDEFRQTNSFVDEDIVEWNGAFSPTWPVTSPVQINTGVRLWVRDRTPTTFKLAPTRGGTAIDITNGTFSGTLTATAVGWISNGDGSIDLAHTPAGRITVDNAGMTPSTDELQHVVVDMAGLPPSKWYGAHVSAYATYEMSLAVYEPTDALEVIDAMVESRNAFWSFRRDGTFQYGNIGSGSPSWAIVADDVIGEVAIERLPVRYDTYACVYARNWTVQTDGFAASVSAEDVARFSQPGEVYRVGAFGGTSYASNPALYHKTMTDGPETMTYLGNATDAGSWTTNRRSLYAPHGELIRLQTRLSSYAMELGDWATVTLPILGFDAGVNAQVVSIDINLSAGRVALTLFRKRTPDTSTAAHYG